MIPPSPRIGGLSCEAPSKKAQRKALFMWYVETHVQGGVEEN
jgi:hypothetical protein